MPQIATQITATAPSDANGEDQTLPDPSGNARWTLTALILLAIGVAFLINGAGWTGKGFNPPKGDFNFSIFAGFYVAAQLIERAMELVVPLLPGWPPEGSTGKVRAAYAKADRAKVALGVASVFGVAASAALGLFFLTRIGIHASHTVDSVATGLVIAAGTKPLHDFISLLQNQNSPKTGTTAT